jgi:folate-binding protein YgfZ
MTPTDMSTLASEYRTLTEECGLLDRSERGKLSLTGSGAVEFLGGQVTNELSTLAPSEGCYAAFLTHKGKMLGDLRILAVGEAGSEVGELLLDTERAALQALFDMINRFKVGYEVQLHKRTLQSSLLSLIGPRSHQLAIDAAEPQAISLARREHSHISTHIAGLAVRLISTTEGVDVLCDEPDREEVSKALLDSGARAVSEKTAEVLRVERGLPRYGLDMDESTIPQEAGLNERAVSFTKGCYVGQETVARLYYKGKPNRHLRGLRLTEAMPTGSPLHFQGRLIGNLASSVISPTFGPIGLALVRREAQTGSTIAVGEENVTAEVLALPFASEQETDR